MTRQQLADLGFGVAVLGMAVTLLSLTPLANPRDPLPWPLFVGSTVYLLGAFCLIANARGETAKKALGKLRYVRMGIIVVVVVLIQRMIAR